jgi:hypothetical protein
MNQRRQVDASRQTDFYTSCHVVESGHYGSVIYHGGVCLVSRLLVVISIDTSCAYTCMLVWLVGVFCNVEKCGYTVLLRESW